LRFCVAPLRAHGFVQPYFLFELGAQLARHRAGTAYPSTDIGREFW
jgi:hypothetical protein